MKAPVTPAGPLHEASRCFPRCPSDFPVSFRLRSDMLSGAASYAAVNGGGRGSARSDFKGETAMPAPVQDFDEDAVEPGPVMSRCDAQQEDAFWQRNFWQERYYRPDLDYEDYAPAYCVGYIGCAQYGGEFADAERSLCANWERIKCDSRLSLQEAMPAIQAAWNRMARLRGRAGALAANEPQFGEMPVREPRSTASLAFSPAAAVS
jgi:hypothetical protein